MKIFISYPDKDQTMARKLKTLCSKWGHECLIAADSPEKLTHPLGWLTALLEQIDSSDIFLLCLNKASLSANFQKMEWAHVCPKTKLAKRVIHEGKWDQLYEGAFPFVGTQQLFCDTDKGLESLRRSLPSDPPEQVRFNFLQQLVIEGGTELVRRQGGRSIYGAPERRDARKNFATNVDEIVQAQIVDQIRERYPDDGIIAEEAPERNFSPHSETGFVWVVDPLDGTLNFAASDDKYCCGVGLLRDGKPFMGAIFVPSRMELYTGGVGREAQCLSLSAAAIRTFHTDSNIEKLSECFALSHINGDERRLAVCFENDLPKQLHLSVRRVWMWGCGLLAALSVAQGRHHLFLQRISYPYDIIPALAILESAGGVWRTIPQSTSLCWNPDKKDVGIIVACSEKILQEFLRRFPNLTHRRSSAREASATRFSSRG